MFPLCACRRQAARSTGRMKRETKHGVNMAGKGERGVQPPATARCTVTFTIFVTPAPCTAWISPSSTSALLAAPALVPVKAWGQTWQFGSLRMALGWQGTGRRLEGARATKPRALGDPLCPWHLQGDPSSRAACADLAGTAPR